MLSYRHGFHAGNFADVLKHFLLTYVLEYLKKKNNSFVYIDANAGAGKYLIDESFMQKNKEYLNGIDKILKTEIKDKYIETISKSLPFLKNKAKTLEDIYNNSIYIFSYNLENKEINKINANQIENIKIIFKKCSDNRDFDYLFLKNILDEIINNKKINFKDIGQPLRIVLTGSQFGPGIYDIFKSLGNTESLKRIEKFLDKIDRNVKN